MFEEAEKRYWAVPFLISNEFVDFCLMRSKAKLFQKDVHCVYASDTILIFRPFEHKNKKVEKSLAKHDAA